MQQDFPLLTLTATVSKNRKTFFESFSSGRVDYEQETLEYVRNNGSSPTFRHLSENATIPQAENPVDLLHDWRMFLHNSVQIVVFRIEPRSVYVDPAQPPTRFQRRQTRN